MVSTDGRYRVVPSVLGLYRLEAAGRDGWYRVDEVRTIAQLERLLATQAYPVTLADLN